MDNKNKYYQKARSILSRHLKSNNLKFTKERDLILKEILQTKKHFDAEEILFTFKQKKIPVSRGSIYRTLPLLVESRILRKVIFTEKHQHYEQNIGSDDHAHLICSICGSIIEFNCDQIYKKLLKTCKDNNFTESGYKLEVTGTCIKCGSNEEK